MAQRGPHAAQDLVAHEVPVLLVYLLEVIHVHEHEREAMPGARAAVDLAYEGVVHGGVVHAAG